MNCFLVSTTLANDKASCVKAFNTLQGAIYSFVALFYIVLLSRITKIDIANSFRVFNHAALCIVDLFYFCWEKKIKPTVSRTLSGDNWLISRSMVHCCRPALLFMLGSL